VYEHKQFECKAITIMCAESATNFSILAAIKFDNTYIVTGGDKHIKVWDAKTGQLIRTLKGHTGHFPPGWVTSLQFDDNKIISG